MKMVKNHPGWFPATMFSIMCCFAALQREGPKPWWIWLICCVWFAPVLLTCWERRTEPTPEELGLTLCRGGCGGYIEEETCGCGDPIKGHGNPMNVGHSPIPLGCNCFRSK